jgi:CRP-like cAMP-binding protein
MVVLAQGGGLWIQLLNLAFFFAALFNDVLLIRISLGFGFLFLILNALTGSPRLPNVFYSTNADGEIAISVDGLVWACFTGFFHYYFIYHLLRDERDVKLETEEHASIWRFFYRRSGMRRLEFLQVLRHAEIIDYQPGDVIADPACSVQYFHLILEGLVELNVVYNDVPSPPMQLHSGDFFDLEVGNVFGVCLGFESDSFEAQAITKCRVMRWSFEEMNRMASHCAPAVSAFWRNMLLYTMANELNRMHPGVKQLGCLDSRGEAEDEALVARGAMSRDFTAPLQPDEQGNGPSIWQWVLRSIKPFPIPGLRHNALPTSGVTARNRVNALLRAIKEAGPSYKPSTSSDRALRRSSLGMSLSRHAAEMKSGILGRKKSQANGASGHAPNRTPSSAGGSSPNNAVQRAHKRLASVKLNSERRHATLARSGGMPPPQPVVLEMSAPEAAPQGSVAFLI